MRLTAKAVGEIIFEITETAVIANPTLALALLARFSEAGVKVSIDDYGSGLSSLAYLKQIRSDELKIDKAFILKLPQNPRDKLLVRSTIELAHGLGMRAVAEGVEDRETFDLLRQMGCDAAQGYLIARPAALPDLVSFLETNAAQWGLPPRGRPQDERASA